MVPTPLYFIYVSLFDLSLKHNNALNYYTRTNCNDEYKKGSLKQNLNLELKNEHQEDIPDW